MAERKAKNLEDAFIGYLEEAAEKAGTKSTAGAAAAEPPAPAEGAATGEPMSRDDSVWAGSGPLPAAKRSSFAMTRYV